MPATTQQDLEKNLGGNVRDTRTTSASLSIPSLWLRPKAVDLKPNRDILPEKTGTKLTRFLKFKFFSTYRKLFSLIFAANMITFVVFVAKHKEAPLITEVATACSANLMTTLLFRQENFVNSVYEIVVAAPHALPLSIRRHLAKVFHYGGVHSGAGVAAVVWFLLYVSLATKEFIEKPGFDTRANFITSWIIMVMFLLILASAYPRFRMLFHNYFEAFHRFAGWITLITFWIHNCLHDNNARKEEGVSLSNYLVHSSNFWFFIVSTSCTVLSWSRLRRRDVYAESLSDHAIRLHFKYKPMQPFYGLKVSSKPFLEWHAFATIPDEDKRGKTNGFSVIVSNAGDWTRENIQNPPKKLWVRGYPLHGLLYTSKLFKKIVLVATGSGIGPCLSLMYADCTPRRILWSTPHPEKTYGATIMNAVLKADPDAIIWNTREMGKPDMVSITYQLVQESGAEAVFIISNPKVTRLVVYGMETRGIPAYGALFDS